LFFFRDKNDQLDKNNKKRRRLVSSDQRGVASLLSVPVGDDGDRQQQYIAVNVNETQLNSTLIESALESVSTEAMDVVSAEDKVAVLRAEDDSEEQDDSGDKTTVYHHDVCQ